jgi:hypothetical protein
MVAKELDFSILSMRDLICISLALYKSQVVCMYVCDEEEKILIFNKICLFIVISIK